MKHITLLLCLLVPLAMFGQPPAAVPGTVKQEAAEFLKMYNSLDQGLTTIASEAQWASSTDVSDEHTGERIGSDKAWAAFAGSPYVVNKCKELLNQKDQLDDLTVKELKKVLYLAAHYPGTIPDVVADRVAAEANQSAVLDGFTFCMEKQGETCTQVVTPNIIDDSLANSTDLAMRKKVWEVSKQTGPALKPGLIKLQTLRNRMATEMGYSSYFGLEVSDYGMTVPEMMQLLETSVDALKPLYEQLHCWTKYKLAEKYKQPVPKKIPAHWLGNRWSQAWPGLVEGVNLDVLFKDKSPEWIIKQAEKFYVSLGMPELPPTFWQKSDLYELPPNAPRKKNTHASAWHMDLNNDVRSLMSVKPDFDWFSTTHHELGHIYYYLAYSNPDVPVVLREGANRAFHEAIGDLIGIASRQVPYLKEIGLMPKDMKIDETQWLLSQAVDDAIVFLPWSAGVMSHWERDFYENNLSPNEYNQRWWNYVSQFQGIEPPEPRGEEFCDPATKTHISDDPAQYYDYALAFLIKYQLHNYIAKNILKQDPHNCNYYGNKEVGAFLWDLLKSGATKDWRQVMKEKTGEDISPKGMLEYFAPLQKYLQKQNKKRVVSWE